jgi:hypothetical protein
VIPLDYEPPRKAKPTPPSAPTSQSRGASVFVILVISQLMLAAVRSCQNTSSSSPPPGFNLQPLPPLTTMPSQLPPSWPRRPSTMPEESLFDPAER